MPVLAGGVTTCLITSSTVDCCKATTPEEVKTRILNAVNLRVEKGEISLGNIDLCNLNIALCNKTLDPTAIQNLNKILYTAMAEIYKIRTEDVKKLYPYPDFENTPMFIHNHIFSNIQEINRYLNQDGKILCDLKFPRKEAISTDYLVNGFYLLFPKNELSGYLDRNLEENWAEEIKFYREMANTPY